MSNAFAMLDHSSKYRSPVQPETLLSTMKSSRPLESTVMTLAARPVNALRQSACARSVLLAHQPTRRPVRDLAGIENHGLGPLFQRTPGRHR